MYTSDNAQRMRRTIIGYAAAAVFCYGFQAIYESFSHGVTSDFMVYAFLIPLAFGILSFLSFSFARGSRGHIFRELLCGSCAWLTLGSIFQGVLEIYGTTNRLTSVFLAVGIAQLVAAPLALLRPIKVLAHE